jgi:hypothetical protein
VAEFASIPIRNLWLVECLVLSKAVEGRTVLLVEAMSPRNFVLLLMQTEPPPM